MPAKQVHQPSAPGAESKSYWAWSLFSLSTSEIQVGSLSGSLFFFLTNDICYQETQHPTKSRSTLNLLFWDPILIMSQIFTRRENKSGDEIGHEWECRIHALVAMCGILGGWLCGSVTV